MAYCTVNEVTDMIKSDLQNLIIGDEYIEDSEERMKRLIPLADSAIQDADAEINGYLAKRYRLPLQEAPVILNKFSKDIAVYNLVSRIGIDESDRDKTFLNRYNAAIKFLTMVAEGKTDIGIATGDAAMSCQSAIGFRMDSTRRMFSRESMRGW